MFILRGMLVLMFEPHRLTNRFPAYRIMKRSDAFLKMMTELLYFLSGKCVVAGERIKLLSWWLIFCSSVTNVITMAINLLIKRKIVAKTERLNDFKSLLSSANLKIQSDVYRLNVKERIIVGKYSEEKKWEHKTINKHNGTFTLNFKIWFNPCYTL